MSEPRNPKVVDLMISRLPPEHIRWCPAIESGGGCACLGCACHVVSKEEFDIWKDRHSFCEHCERFKLTERAKLIQFNEWQEKRGYLDSDWWSEPPNAIDRFLDGDDDE